ncbi:MAG TPA: methylmalonyl-CoA mutase, partial [Rhodospirillaceae bacterium]|nr:methylmalonyl-CoA mutase [Rhodospirillaceae bacterium]
MADSSKQKIDGTLEPRRQPPTKPSTTTPSGIEVPVVVTPDMVSDRTPEMPGEYPFTRGIFPDGFRGCLWTIRQ